MSKVYLVIEKYTQDCERNEEVGNTSVVSVNKTLEGAVNSAMRRHDDIIEEIIDGDENELSRISVDDVYHNEGRANRWVVVDDCCSEWDLKIIENNLED